MTGRAGGRGDVGRRAALRREQLGLSREEVAARAGMAPAYVRYVEEQAGTPDTASLLRLAAALETSADRLMGGGADLPEGLGRAARHPQLLELGPQECRELLGTHGVGRVAVSADGGAPAVFPVNYTVAEDTIAFRTASDGSLDRAAGGEVAFQADHVDEALSQGWSVLVTGPLNRVTDPAAARRLSDRAHTTPWAGGGRDQWMGVEARRVTGRRIRVP